MVRKNAGRSFIGFFVWVALGVSTAQALMRPEKLRCEYKNEPYTDVAQPRLSWQLQAESRAQRQTAFQILVASKAILLMQDQGDLWDSGKVTSDATCQIVYEGAPLTSRQRCYWKVRVWDQHGSVGPWSQFARWEMGLLDPNDWQAEWIGLDLTEHGQGPVYHLPPVPYLRKDVDIKPDIDKVRLYVTALGLYEFSINGEKVGEDWLTPGWTNYNKRLPYQIYDVTDQIMPGENALGVKLSYGWYAGYVGYAQLVKLPKVKGFYGDVPALKARLEVTYNDGSQDVFVTNGSWKASGEGPLIESDLLHGETYDARKEFDYWDCPGFDDQDWGPVEVMSGLDRPLEYHSGVPVRETETLRPQSFEQREDGTIIVDMGQNFAGLVRLRVKGEAGQRVTLRFGEMLHPDGRLMTENLRMARATDTYILRGDPLGETWTPSFTYHGFRYVEVTGYPGEFNHVSIRGVVLGSDTPRAGTFHCSHEKLNQLYSNIVWSQRANFLEVPTDCPQRDERLGWTGDAQVFASTAALTMDVAAFFTKWLRDLNDEQWPDGSYPNFAPRPFNREGMRFSPGWMEAGIICPYAMYKAYGDLRVIRTYWSQMEKFMAFHEKRSQGTYVYPEGSFEDIVPKGGFSDWLSIGTKTSPDMLATMYYGHCAQLMAEMAQAIGRPGRAGYYQDIAVKVTKAFNKHYVRKDGRFQCNAKAYGDGKGYVDGDRGFTGHTQTAYANALMMNMLPEDREELVGEYLKGLVAANGGRLSTGFLGVKPLLPALSKVGADSLAYGLLLNESYPSWLYSVNQGATTIWERWNAYTVEQGFMKGMNSFNHYAFGSVYEWMFQHMGGILNPGVGYEKIIFKPVMDERIDEVKVTYASIRGDILSHWRVVDGQLTYDVEVPPNVLAIVYLPTSSQETVTESGRSIETVKDVVVNEFKDGVLRIDLGSGSYHFGSRIE